MSPFFGVSLIFLLFLFPSAASAADAAPANLPRIAEDVRAKLYASLNQIHTDLASAAKDIALQWPVEARQKRALLKLFKTNTYAVDCGFVDLDGKMTIVAPKRFRKDAGPDAGKPKPEGDTESAPRRDFQAMILPVEDFQALDFQYPVLVPGKGLAGHVSMLVRIQSIFSRFAAPLAQRGVDLWVMRKDGTVVYGLTEQDRGKNIFDDERYKPFSGFLKMAEWVSGEKEGSGAYEYGPKDADRAAHHSYAWTTLNFGGLEWRIVAVLSERPKTLP